jgi:hypothetical protein
MFAGIFLRNPVEELGPLIFVIGLLHYCPDTEKIEYNLA